MSSDIPGSAPRLFVAGQTPLLHPAQQVFEAMLSGWRDQQLSRNLGTTTVEPRLRLIRRFHEYTNDYPWCWRPGDLEAFSADLRGGGLARATLRTYQHTIGLFCDYVADPRYQWIAVCEEQFDDHPAQICFEWNTAQHTDEQEGRPQRRALTKRELQDLFDYADDRVVSARTSGHKGWWAAARDAAALKTTYAWGLRRREAAKLDLADFASNPHAQQFGDFGVVYVRWGKANKGSTPKRRSVLTVFQWSVEVLEEWIHDTRPAHPRLSDGPGLWPSERSGQLSPEKLGARFAEYRDALDLPKELSLHCLRHSYVTHLLEDGFDPLFVQHQVGHSHSSTTALYTSVSSDFRIRTLGAALTATVGRCLATQT